MGGATLATTATGAAAYAALLGCAALGSVAGFAVAAAAAYLVEAVGAARDQAVGRGLRALGLGPPARSLLRGLAAVLLVAGGTAAGWLAGAWAVVALALAGLTGLSVVAAHLRKSPVLARGLAIEVAAVPRALPWLRVRHLSFAALVDLPLVVAALAGTGGREGAALTVALALVGTALVVLLVPAAAHVLRLRSAGPRASVPRAVQAAVDELAPEVLLYHAGSAGTVYQVEQWLDVVEELGRPALVLLRDREAWRRLGPTSLPVVCVPASTRLVSFDLTSARAALFVANGTGNVHLLRKGGLATAFIGHGDSDKASSSLAFSRVYDQIWVAGPAGRRRYERSAVRLAPEALVEVGRPQLRLPGRPVAGPPYTVLYAPTWEGWGDEPFHTSLRDLGAQVVRRLLASPDLRVVYRPHPLTGSLDAATARAHQEVLAALRASGAPDPDPLRATPGGRRGPDDLDVTLGRASVPAATTPVARPSGGRPTHRAVGGDDPDLLACLAGADLLITDVSGVLTDWLATDRPYVVLDPSAAGSDTLARSHPSTGAATVSGPDLVDLDVALQDLRHGRDPHAALRARLRTDLLGAVAPGDPGPFAEAVRRLVGLAVP